MGIKCESFGDWLRIKLNFYGWSVVDLAKMLEVKQPVVSMWLTNKRIPTRENMGKLLSVFGLDSPEVVRRRVEKELKDIYKPTFYKKHFVNRERVKSYEEELEEKINKFEFTEF